MGGTSSGGGIGFKSGGNDPNNETKWIIIIAVIFLAALIGAALAIGGQ